MPVEKGQWWMGWRVALVRASLRPESLAPGLWREKPPPPFLMNGPLVTHKKGVLPVVFFMCCIIDVE